MFLKEFFHQSVFLVDFVLLLRDINLLRGIKVAVLTLATLSMASTSEGIELLVNSKHKGMECSTSYFFYSLVRKCRDPFGLLEEFSVTMSALTLVELWSLASSPGVEIALRIEGCAVVVST
jgi:hypothetical protein